MLTLYGNAINNGGTFTELHNVTQVSLNHYIHNDNEFVLFPKSGNVKRWNGKRTTSLYFNNAGIRHAKGE